MSRLRVRSMLVVAGLLAAGCRLPDPEPLGDTIPGFEPCRAGHLEDVPYDICPQDAQFPYGEWVAGVVEGAPAVFGAPASVVLHANGADWNLDAVAHYSVSFAGDDWSDATLADAPAIELRVSAPCGSPDHWFAVRSADSGFLLAAGRVAATATVDDWTIDATSSGDTCPEPVADCPCSAECTVDPIRFSWASGAIDLYPSERTFAAETHHAMAFERWTAMGESTCGDGRTEGRRWLLLGEG